AANHFHPCSRVVYFLHLCERASAACAASLQRVSTLLSLGCEDSRRSLLGCVAAPSHLGEAPCCFRTLCIPPNFLCHLFRILAHLFCDAHAASTVTSLPRSLDSAESTDCELGVIGRIQRSPPFLPQRICCRSQHFPEKPLSTDNRR